LVSGAFRGRARTKGMRNCQTRKGPRVSQEKDACAMMVCGGCMLVVVE